MLSLIHNKMTKLLQIIIHELNYSSLHNSNTLVEFVPSFVIKFNDIILYNFLNYLIFSNLEKQLTVCDPFSAKVYLPSHWRTEWVVESRYRCMVEMKLTILLKANLCMTY